MKLILDFEKFEYMEGQVMNEYNNDELDYD